MALIMKNEYVVNIDGFLALGKWGDYWIGRDGQGFNEFLRSSFGCDLNTGFSSGPFDFWVSDNDELSQIVLSSFILDNDSNKPFCIDMGRLSFPISPKEILDIWVEERSSSLISFSETHCNILSRPNGGNQIEVEISFNCLGLSWEFNWASVKTISGDEELCFPSKE